MTQMIIVNPVPNTTLIELDVDNSNPQVAAQLANEVSQRFAEYANSQLSAVVHIEPAVQPTTPIRPKPSTYGLIGALVGLALAIALIVIFEWSADLLSRPDEVQELLGLETLATISQLSRVQRNKDAESIPILAEACRFLSANLNPANTVKPLKLIMVSSSLAEEGKSTIAANLACFLAKTGKRVLLVDADMRHPVLDRHFQLDNLQGLSTAFLERGQRVEEVLEGQPTNIPTLRVLTAGVQLENPADLLQSQMATQVFDHFKKAAKLDYVIFDTPPLLLVADAQILASHMHAVLFVVDASKTPRKALRRAKQILNRIHITLGVIVNKSRWSDYVDINRYIKDVELSQAVLFPSMSKPPETPSVRVYEHNDGQNGIGSHQNGHYKGDLSESTTLHLNANVPLSNTKNE